MSSARLLFVESYPHVLCGQQRTLLSLMDASRGLPIIPLIGVTAEGIFCDAVRDRGLALLVFSYPALLGTYGGAVYRYRGLKQLQLIGQGLRYLLELRARLAQLRLDGVFCNDLRGLLTVGLAARSLGLPVLIWDKLDQPHGWLDWLQLPLATTNVIIANAVTRKYPAWQRVWFGRRIVRVSEGADLDRYDAAYSIRQTLPVVADDVVLAIVGTITKRKGHQRIFSIWPDLLNAMPNLRLLVVGEPSGNTEDARYLAELPNLNHPRIHFMGRRDDIPNLMKSIDLLLVPSLNEGTPLVIFEAMAAGRPVIGANAGGIPELVSDGETGFIVAGDNQAGWMAAIGRAAGSPGLRASLGANGRRLVERRFNRSVQLRRVLQLCLEMTRGE